MSWKDVHANLSRLARAKGALDAEEATWLLRAKRERVHEYLGYATLAEYLERTLGYRPRLAAEKIRVAEALEELPEMRAKLAAAELSWSAVRELSRVATAGTEALWPEAALGKTVREVERMASGRKPGDAPDAPADLGAMRITLRLDISADTMAAFREIRDQCTREVGHRLEDDEVLRMICEKALVAGGRDEGRSAYQVKLSVCTECGRGERAAAGELHPMEPARVEQALCDAQVIGANPEDPQRATQKVPPRIRRSVVRRDEGCMVPGCRNSVFKEVHHVIPRSEGGTHDPERLTDLCSAHHAGVHRGAIRIEGTYTEGFRVYHADGRPYGTAPLAPVPTWVEESEPPRSARVGGGDPRPPESDMTEDVIRGLHRLGFSRSEARRAVNRAASHSGGSVEALLRASLRELTPGWGASRCSEPALLWGSGHSCAEAP